jgi:hypothetical protein
VKAHIFVDESKVRGLLLAAAVIPPSDLAPLRKMLGGLRLPGQRRIHFSAESDARRKVILRAMGDAGLEARIYDATSIKNLELARDAAISWLVEDAAELGAELLVFERDDRSMAADRATVHACSKLARCSQTLRLVHKRAYEDCLLSVPDAVAWAWVKAGRWRDRVKPLISEIIQVKVTRQDEARRADRPDGNRASEHRVLPLCFKNTTWFRPVSNHTAHVGH